MFLLEARNKWEADINIQKCSKERKIVGRWAGGIGLEPFRVTEKGSICDP